MKHVKYTDKELKDIVVKVYDGKIFTSKNVREDNLLFSIFMPLVFIGAPPTKPFEPNLKDGVDIKEKRKNKLNHFKEIEKWKKDIKFYNEITYPEWKKNEKPKIDKFIEDIGMVFESIDKTSHLGINGYPMFMSCKFMDKYHTEKFMEFYKKYEEIRKQVDNF